MRQIKTITKNVTFVPVSGQDFYQDFFDEKGNIEDEPVIESVYCNSILKSTSGKADVIKKKVGRGVTDGLIRFRYDGEIINFYGIQECKIYKPNECKKKSKRDSSKYKNQVAQALLYNVQLSQCKVLIINSEYYFDYILIDENIDFINEHKDELLNLLSLNSPSKVASKFKFDLNKLKIHTCNVPTPVKIDQIMLNIYRNCI